MLCIAKNVIRENQELGDSENQIKFVGSGDAEYVGGMSAKEIIDMRKDSSVMDVTIVLPTYNEEKNIQNILKRIDNVFMGKNREIIIIDDDSTDRTRFLAKQHPYPVRVIRRRTKGDPMRSFSRSLLLGMSISKYPYIVTMDADGSHDPAMIPLYIYILHRGVDMVIGSRYVKDGHIRDWPFYRNISSRILNYLAQKKMKTVIKDCSGGFRGYRKELLLQMGLWDHIKSRHFGIQLEILKYALDNGADISEMPIIFEQRHAGKSKTGRKHVIEFLSLLKHL